LGHLTDGPQPTIDMRPLTTAVFVVASVALVTASLNAQGLNVTALEAAARQELTRHRVPGAAIAIVKDDRVVYMRAFGVANLETGEAVRPETLFPIGSLTKSLTSAALVSLAVSGKMRLDDPVGTYVPGLAPPIARLTTAQLLSHTAGLVDLVPVSDRSRDESALSSFPRSWGEAALFTEPGRIFSVSNSGYWLAGAALEAVAQKPYADAMKLQVFEPLGMTSTSLRPSEAITWPFAQGYMRERTGGLAIVRPLSSYPLFWPSGAVLSSVRDLSRFMIAFLNAGQLDGKQVLDSKVIVAMTTAHAKVATNPSGEYGYGLFLDTIRGVRVWQHGGQRPGYGATIRMAPDYRVGVVILANENGGEMPETAMRALELMLPLDPAQPAAPLVALTTTPDDLLHHPGVYRNQNDEIEILSSDGRLLVKRGERTRPLVKRSEVRFDSDSLGWYVFTSGGGDRTAYVSAGNQSYGRVK